MMHIDGDEVLVAELLLQAEMKTVAIRRLEGRVDLYRELLCG